MKTRKSERGQSAILTALAFVGLLAFLALAVDGGKLYGARQERNKAVDAACLTGAVVAANGGDAYTAIVNNLAANGFDTSFFTPQEGSGTGLKKGIEIGTYIRIAISGPVQSYFSWAVGNPDGWDMGAHRLCKAGIGGPAPLVNKEFEEPDSKILSTNRPNDIWSGPCEDQTLDPASDPSTRPQPNCWLYGDWQVLAGEGHLTNEGRTSMNGIVALDVRCQGAPSDTNKCDDKLYLPNDAPPTSDVPQSNTLKSLTMNYILAGGYNGPAPIPGVYTGPNSANVGEMDGVSNHQLVQAIESRYGVGDNMIVYVYANGQLWDGRQNYDYVEIIGLELVKIVYTDANTVAVVPVYPTPESYTGPGGEDFTLRGFLPTTVQELADAAGLDIRPHLLMWELGG